MHGAGRLVPEHHRVLPRRVHLVELAVADAAREQLDHDLVWTRIGQREVLHLEWAGMGRNDDDAGGCGHGDLLLGNGQTRIDHSFATSSRTWPNRSVEATAFAGSAIRLRVITSL